MPRLLLRCVQLLAFALCCARFFYLTADFPNFSPWMLDQAKYADEGWWASGAVMHHLLGHWYVAADYNPAVALPVWPLLLDVLFRFTGVSLVAARALSVLLSLATLGIVFALVRRHSPARSEYAATLAILILAASPFAFAFSRLAILDSFVVFQFCLLLLVASHARERPVVCLACLAVLIPVIMLTKTTAAVLLPAVAWMAVRAMPPRATLRFRLLAPIVVGAFAALMLRAYAVFAVQRGFGEDYRYFFAVNALEDVDWSQTLPTLGDAIAHCMWVDRVLFPFAILLTITSTVWQPNVRRNPLFGASCLAFAGQIAFLWRTQGNYAPRYFLVMLVPLAIVSALAIEELRTRLSKWVGMCAVAMVAVACILNVSTIVSFIHHRTFQFYNAGTAIARIIRSEQDHSQLILSVSGSNMSLMTGLPSINDVFGTKPLDEKVAIYHPGWYLAWNGIAPPEQAALTQYRIERVAEYPAFDDDERNRLILFRLTPIAVQAGR
jgi:4-amino-4-deoxy-L-arabinose transferase-like glycosyltransferase